MAENLTRQILREHLADGELEPGSSISCSLTRRSLTAFSCSAGIVADCS